MKLRLPKWFQQPTQPTPDAPAPSTAEIVAQLEQRLSEADGEVLAGETRSQELLAKFAATRTGENLEDQEAAEGDLAQLRKLRSLVVDDLGAARAKLEAEKRAALEARKVELHGALSDRDRENELTQVEIGAWLAIADIRMRRIDEAQRRSNLKSELLRIRLALGENDARPEYGLDGPYTHTLVEPIRDAARGLPSNDTRVRLIFNLAEFARQS